MAMTQTPVLALPNFQEPFVIETDACQDGVGVVLMQHGRPVAYLSKALSGRNKDISIYEKEFLALIMAVEKWRHYLQRNEFTILTDLQASSAVPKQIVDRRLVKKGNAAITQVKVTWTELPATICTWEDYNVLKQRFPKAPAWGQAETQGGGGVTATTA